MERQGAIVYQVDENDCLTYLNEQWGTFAEDNDTPYLTNTDVENKLIWDFIQDSETRHIHETLLKRVRVNNLTLKFPFRCDSPAVRRFMEMEISPLNEGKVEYCCRIIREEPRDPIPLVHVKEGSEEPHLRMCSWCKKLDVGNDTWFEIEDAIKHLGLFHEASIPFVSHTMCNACMDDLDDE
jgi:hypothetical protein